MGVSRKKPPNLAGKVFMTKELFIILYGNFTKQGEI